MPSNLKRRVRERMAKTGESYQTALRHVRAQGRKTLRRRVTLCSLCKSAEAVGGCECDDASCNLCAACGLQIEGSREGEEICELLRDLSPRKQSVFGDIRTGDDG